MYHATRRVLDRTREPLHIRHALAVLLEEVSIGTATPTAGSKRTVAICVYNRSISPTLIDRMTIPHSNAKFFHRFQHGTLKICAKVEKTPKNGPKQAPNSSVVKRVHEIIDSAEPMAVDSEAPRRD